MKFLFLLWIIGNTPGEASLILRVSYLFITRLNRPVMNQILLPFLLKLCGVENPQDRDVGTAVVNALAVSKGSNIIRVHNPTIGKQTAVLVDAILGKAGAVPR